MATKKVNTTSVQGTLDNLKTKVKALNVEAITMSDQLVEASLASGEKWQKLMGKTLNQGTVLLGKQQDLVFSALEELKGQYVEGNKRFKKLFGMDTVKTPKVKREKVAVNTTKVVATSLSDLAKDDLKTINGIGPKMEQLLNAAGIFTYYQLSNANNKDLKAILETAGPRFKTQNPADWKKEAQKLV